MLISRLSTLAHPQRMDVFRLLMRRYPDRVAAGEIGAALGLKPSTASTYLAALTSAGLITQAREGTSLRYQVNLDVAQGIVTGLFRDCCQGRADLCPPQISTLLGSMTPMTDQRFNVLFVCTGNSARSIFAESILHNMAGDKFAAYSAGTAHQSELNPYAVELLKAQGHDISRLRSKNVKEFQGPDAPRMDFVFTVCDLAANEDCPTWPGQPVSGHWGMRDPVKAQGTDAEKRLAFHQTYGALHNRITAFSALPVANLDRVTLQKRVDDIGVLEDS